MRAARSSTGTGGNPNVGAPVHFARFPKSLFRLHCTPCPPPPPTFSPPSPPSQALSARESPPYDDISQAETKNNASELAVSEGYNFASLARDSLVHHPNLVFPTLSSHFTSSPSFSSLSYSESDENDDDEPVCLFTNPYTQFCQSASFTPLPTVPLIVSVGTAGAPPFPPHRHAPVLTPPQYQARSRSVPPLDVTLTQGAACRSHPPSRFAHPS
jgi:hypothetical protein